MNAPQRHWQRRAAWIAAAVFLLLLWLPTVQGLSGFAPEPRRSENRRLAPRPQWRGELSLAALRTLRTEAGAYFDDHFGFRKSLVRWRNWFGLRVFGRSPVPRVLAGKDGWLYLAAKDPVRLPNRAAPFTPEALDRWVAALEARRAVLAEEGSAFLVVLTPDKQSVYPEFLPDELRGAPLDARLNQIAARLRERGGLDVLDLRPALLAAKRGGRLFHRTDTHWNAVGANVGYREIVGAVAHALPRWALPPPRARADYTLRSEVTPGGNLARMLAMGDLLTEENLRLTAAQPYRAVRSRPPRDFHRRAFQMTLYEQPGAQALPSAVMLHNSYTNALMRDLSEHFRRILYVRGNTLDLELVRRERPDIVIHQIGEGALEYPSLD